MIHHSGKKSNFKKILKYVTISCLFCILIIICNQIGGKMKKLALILGVIFMTGIANAKSIVVYYSKTGEQYGVGVIKEGNTAKVAKEIALQTGADLLELKTVKEYPEGYSETTRVAQTELRENARPELSTKIPDLSQYDTIYLGYPIWWGNAPMCVYTFLDSVDLSGKTVKPFCTHEGSGASGTQAKIQKAAKGANVKEVLSIRGTVAQKDAEAVKKEVKAWIGK